MIKLCFRINVFFSVSIQERFQFWFYLSEATAVELRLPCKHLLLNGLYPLWQTHTPLEQSWEYWLPVHCRFDTQALSTVMLPIKHEMQINIRCEKNVKITFYMKIRTYITVIFLPNFYSIEKLIFLFTFFKIFFWWWW